MSRILHICASPKGSHSGSRQLAQLFLDEYTRINPSDETAFLPLFEKELPEFGADQVRAKFSALFGDGLNVQQHAKWREILTLIEAFNSHDKILLSTPMWNFSIPYRLKQYIDILVQPFVTFGYDASTQTHFGMLRDRPLQLILTRSSVMPSDPADFQLSYLRHIFQFIGIRDIRALIAPQTTKPSKEERSAYLASFSNEVREAARAF